MAEVSQSTYDHMLTMRGSAQSASDHYAAAAAAFRVAVVTEDRQAAEQQAIADGIGVVIASLTVAP